VSFNARPLSNWCNGGYNTAGLSQYNNNNRDAAGISQYNNNRDVSGQSTLPPNIIPQTLSYATSLSDQFSTLCQTSNGMVTTEPDSAGAKPLSCRSFASGEILPVVFNPQLLAFDNSGSDDRLKILNYFKFIYPSYSFSNNDIDYLIYNYRFRLNVVFDVGQQVGTFPCCAFSSKQLQDTTGKTNFSSMLVSGVSNNNDGTNKNKKQGFFNPINPTSAHLTFTTPFVEIWNPKVSSSGAATGTVSEGKKQVKFLNDATEGSWFLRCIGSGLAMEMEACLYARNIIHGFALMHCTTENLLHLGDFLKPDNSGLGGGASSFEALIRDCDSANFRGVPIDVNSTENMTSSLKLRTRFCSLLAMRGYNTFQFSSQWNGKIHIALVGSVALPVYALNRCSNRFTYEFVDVNVEKSRKHRIQNILRWYENVTAVRQIPVSEQIGKSKMSVPPDEPVTVPIPSSDAAAASTNDSSESFMGRCIASRGTVHLDYENQSWAICGEVSQPEPTERSLKNTLILGKQMEEIVLTEVAIYPVSTIKEKLVAYLSTVYTKRSNPYWSSKTEDELTTFFTNLEFFYDKFPNLPLSAFPGKFWKGSGEKDKRCQPNTWDMWRRSNNVRCKSKFTPAETLKFVEVSRGGFKMYRRFRQDIHIGTYYTPMSGTGFFIEMGRCHLSDLKQSTGVSLGLELGEANDPVRGWEAEDVPLVWGLIQAGQDTACWPKFNVVGEIVDVKEDIVSMGCLVRGIHPGDSRWNEKNPLASSDTNPYCQWKMVTPACYVDHRINPSNPGQDLACTDSKVAGVKQKPTMPTPITC